MDEKRPLRLLFVCSGNICRSPMAAGIADQVALELAVDVEIRSAGTLGLVDRPAAAYAVTVCRELGVDLAAHRSQPLTADLVGWADRIFVMEPEHAAFVRELAPELDPERIVGLGPYAGQPFVADPLGSWFAWSYRKTRDLLVRAVRGALAETVAAIGAARR